MTAQTITKIPINFKSQAQIVPISYNQRQTPPMPNNYGDSFVMEQNLIRQQQKRERSRDNWNKAGTIASCTIAASLLLSGLAMLTGAKALGKMGGKMGGAARKKEMGDPSLKFMEIVKDSLPSLDGDSVNPKTRDFIKLVKDRINLDPEVAKYSGSKAAEQCVLIYGPTGTGKTFSAKLLAKELDAQYAEVDFPKIASPYVGQASANIREAFENIAQIAKENPDKRFLVAFNEIDSMLIPMGHASAEKAHVLENRTAFLNGLDIVKEHKNVSIVGTTNANPKSGNLDFAALGRFGNLFEIELPTKKELIASLKWHLKDCEAVEKYKFFEKNKSEIERFASKLHSKHYSQRDVEKLAGNALTRFGIDIGKKSKADAMKQKFDIKYLKEALKNKGETTGDMQGKLDGKYGDGQRFTFMQRLAFLIFGGRKAA